MNEKKQLSVKNVPAELLQEAQIKAIREGRPLSEVVREFLESWVQKDNKPQPSPK